MYFKPFFFFFFFSSSVSRLFQSLQMKPVSSVRGPAELRLKDEVDWTRVMFAQKMHVLEYWMGNRLCGSPSLARLSFFPKVKDGVLHLVFDDNVELFVTPLDAPAAEWEKKIREWAAYTQQISIEELLVPLSQRKKMEDSKKKDEAKKTPVLSVKKNEEPSKPKKEEPSKPEKRESSVRLSRLTKKEEVNPAQSSSPTQQQKQQQQHQQQHHHHHHQQQQHQQQQENGTKLLSTIRNSVFLQALRKSSSRDDSSSGTGSVRSSFSSDRGNVRVSLPEIDVAPQIVSSNSEFGSSGHKLTNGKWKSCWFRLADGKLLCFESASSKIPLSFMDVKPLLSLRLEEESKKRFVVSVTSMSGVSRKMMFDSREIAEEWMQVLEKLKVDVIPSRTHGGTVLEIPDQGDVIDLQTAQMCLTALQAFDGEEDVAAAGETTDLGDLLDDMLSMDDRFEKTKILLFFYQFRKCTADLTWKRFACDLKL